MAYIRAPLAEGRNDFFSNPVLADIGNKYGKSVAQVALRWLLHDVIIIPKSTHIERMVEIFNTLAFCIDYQRVINTYFRMGNKIATPEVFYQHFPECIGMERLTG